MNELFKKVFNKEIEQEYFSPGRINLIGEHIDYNGGEVFPMAIQLGTHGYLKMRDDKIVNCYSLNFEEQGIISFSIDDNKFNDNLNWANYVLGTIRTFIEEGYSITNGFDIMINGTIPNGSGLSSSASLEVLIGRILIENFNLDVNDTKLALLAQKAENEFIGVNCGIMDQFIIANGTKDGALTINTDTLDFKTVEFDLKDNVIVVLNSNKKRGLVDSKYNDRRASCENVLEMAKKDYDINTLCAMTIEQLDKLDVSKEDYKRAYHAITEQKRVLKAQELLKSGNIIEFGQVLNEGHQSLKNMFEVSCEELDFIVDKCLENGAIGARMTGAGFGGCCICIINKVDVDNLENIKAPYKDKFGLELEYYEVFANDKTKKIK